MMFVVKVNSSKLFGGTNQVGDDGFIEIELLRRRRNRQRRSWRGRGARLVYHNG